MPSSSLAEIKVEVEVEVGVEVWVGVKVEVGVGVGVWVKMQFSFLTFFGGGMGWLEKSDIKLISTQVVVEVGVELGKITYYQLQIFQTAL